MVASSVALAVDHSLVVDMVVDMLAGKVAVGIVVAVVVVDRIVVPQNSLCFGLSFLSQNHRSPNHLDGYKCFLNSYHSIIELKNKKRRGKGISISFPYLLA